MNVRLPVVYSSVSERSRRYITRGYRWTAGVGPLTEYMAIAMCQTQLYVDSIRRSSEVESSK